MRGSFAAGSSSGTVELRDGPRTSSAVLMLGDGSMTVFFAPLQTCLFALPPFVTVTLPTDPDGRVTLPVPIGASIPALSVVGQWITFHATDPSDIGVSNGFDFAVGT